jgi:hypothetical protein
MFSFGNFTKKAKRGALGGGSPFERGGMSQLQPTRAFDALYGAPRYIPPLQRVSSDGSRSLFSKIEK